MSDIALIVTGDDADLPVTLSKDGVTFTIDPGATVQAAVVSTDRETTLLAAVTCDNGATGADWANSLVVVEFPSADTGALTEETPALLEIQVDDNGKKTWFTDVQMDFGKPR